MSSMRWANLASSEEQARFADAATEGIHVREVDRIFEEVRSSGERSARALPFRVPAG